MMLKNFLLYIAVCSACQTQNMLEEIVVGQDITVFCGVQVKGNFTRLVWKREDLSRREKLAYIYEGEIQCNTALKEDCVLRPDGSLELRNVQETDSGDYFCVVDNEKYYSKHTLVVHPEDVSPSSVDHSESRLEPCPEAFCPVFRWIFVGIAIIVVLGVLAKLMVVLLLHKRNKFISAKPEVTEALLDKQKVNIGMQLELKCVVKGHPIPTVYWFKDGKQLASQAGYNTTFSKGVATLTTLITNRAAEGIFLCIAVNSAGIASTSCTLIVEGTEQQGPPQNSVVESGRQPPILPVTAHQETTQNGAEELEMEPLMGENKTNRQPSDTRQKHVQQDTAVSTQEETDGQSNETRQTHHQVQPPIPLKTPQDSRRPRPLSAIKVTTDPQYQGQNQQSDGKPVTMGELILNFQSGPRITLLPLNEIRPYGLEIRSPSDGALKVIRKSEEKYDVPLVCQKDGQRWDIHPGDQSDFYVSCGHCNKGCLLVGISGGEQNLKKITE